MSEPVGIRVLTGANPALRDHVPDLARLRIEVFRAFPYLYDGTVEYETKYLKTYLDCPESVVVLALDRGCVVGAATAMPLDQETAEFQAPFRRAGIDPSRVFYCGESVLLPDYRGRGVYRHFLTERERHARALGRFDRITMCGVVRPPDHPRRPPDYVPLDEVWAHFGYQPRPDLVATFEWKDLDELAPTAKPMVFREKLL